MLWIILQGLKEKIRVGGGQLMNLVDSYGAACLINAHLPMLLTGDRLEVASSTEAGCTGLIFRAIGRHKY